MTERFTWTITEAGFFLGKAHITMRKWESDGIFVFPRNEFNNRFVDTTSMAELAQAAYDARRITTRRRELILHGLAYLAAIEEENHAS